VAGQLAGNLRVRTLGGEVGNVAQIVEGPPTFTPGQPSLVFVRPRLGQAGRAADGSFVVVEAGQGQFLVEAKDGQGRRLARLRRRGRGFTRTDEAGGRPRLPSCHQYVAETSTVLVVDGCGSF